MKDTPKLTKEQEQEMLEKFDTYEVPEFGNALFGYNKAEVDQYLSALVDAYNKLIGENAELAEKLAAYEAHKTEIAEAIIEAKITAAGIRSAAKAEAGGLSPGMDLTGCAGPSGELEPIFAGGEVYG